MQQELTLSWRHGKHQAQIWFWSSARCSWKCGGIREKIKVKDLFYKLKFAIKSTLNWQKWRVNFPNSCVYLQTSWNYENP